MKLKLIYISIFLVLSITMIGCLNQETTPTNYDGTMDIILQVHFDIDSLNYKKYFSSIPVDISTYDYNNFSFIDSTDTNGIIEITNVPFAEYNVNINSEIFVDYGSFIDTMPVVVSGIFTPNSSIDSICRIEIISGGSGKGLKINEIYTVGPPNNFFYFYDQFFELYNSSNETKYLDGMVFCRMWTSITEVTSIFQFPGEPLVGKEYPVEPGEFVVLAQDAYNHKDEIFNGNVSIDLTVADWEFVNSLDYGDWDNPDVPNLECIEVGEHREFMVGLTSDVLLLADGSDVEYIDGIDSASVVDGAEYCAWSGHTKCLESYIDRGFGGVGLQKYSGQSLERKVAGFDTDNSTIDFEIISAPTIGYQHE
ncbi:MAG: DUF4876 domain-containing protein [Candidatus Marinimicrobia bacterium]|nr:DUF4876 domain-containing protein [Candidatus Neomarinimicrobiota bacterium]